MKRRQFLLAMASTVALVPPLAHAARTTARKGFAANVENPAHIAALAPDFILLAWGAWLIDPAKRYGAVKLAICLYDQDPSFPLNAANLQAVRANHAGVEITWVCLREPDLHQTPQQAANEANQQMVLVLGVDPAAQFCVSVGTGENPPYKENSFARQMWSLLQFKYAIAALGVTWYPYGNAPAFRKFVNNFVEYKPDREHWILEHGQIVNETPTVGIAAGVPFTLLNARAEMEDAGIERGCWYSQVAIPNTPAANYVCLQNTDGSLTNLGDVF